MIKLYDFFKKKYDFLRKKKRIKAMKWLYARPRKMFQYYRAVFHCKTTGFGWRPDERNSIKSNSEPLSNSGFGLYASVSGADTCLVGKLEGIPCENGDKRRQ